jgi:hypothetical protein
MSSSIKTEIDIKGEWVDKEGNTVAIINEDTIILTKINIKMSYAIESRSKLSIRQEGYPPETLYYSIRNGKLLLYFPLTEEGTALYRKNK